MGMPIFDPLINALTPHLNDFKHISHSVGERIISRLDLILAALQSEDFQEIRSRDWFTFTTNTTFDSRYQIPTTEEWELEFVSCSGGATVTITEGGDATFRYAKQFTVADSQQGLGLIFGGGCAPQVSIAGAVAFPVGVAVQWKRRVRIPAKASRTAGLGGVFDDQLNLSGHDPHGGQDYSLIPRHMQPLNHGQNVNGFDGNTDNQPHYRG